MSLSWIVNSTASALLLPPVSLILLCVLGMLLRRRWPRFGMTVLLGTLIITLLLSTRLGALLFITPLEKMNPPLSTAQAQQAQAIVVLGGGRIADAPEYDGQDIPSSTELQRLHYAARLQRQTGLPVLVTGGRPDGSPESEAAIMARTLRNDFSVPVKWLEEESDNTAENAQFSARLLRESGVQKVLLVTDAMHMERSRRIFAMSGLDVVPAPTIFFHPAHWSLDDFLPKTIWLQRSSYAMHEWIGLVWYQLRYRNAGTEATLR
jgi:uncharacterized SAM-binding protein YcdF (DUF218 family)